MFCLHYQTNPPSFDSLNNWKAGFIEKAVPYDQKSFPFVLIGNIVAAQKMNSEAISILDMKKEKSIITVYLKLINLKKSTTRSN